MYKYLYGRLKLSYGGDMDIDYTTKRTAVEDCAVTPMYLQDHRHKETNARNDGMATPTTKNKRES